MKQKLFLTLLSLSVFASCSKEALPLTVIDDCTQQSSFSMDMTTEGEYVLGSTIKIPYSIENLQKAYSSLDYQTRSSIDISSVQPTHYYIRFKPKNSDELDILRNLEPRVFLSEVPLDREIVVHGSYYHDPTIPDNMPTFQYTTLPVERWPEINNIPVESEILIKAYIPDYDDEYVETRTTSEATNYEILLKKAYEICGLKYEEVIETRGGSWNPSGRVRSFDTHTNSYIPIKGVRIRGTHLLKVKETLTDNNGEFELASFKNPVNMKIVWESDEWDVRQGEFGQVSFDGPKLDHSAWNIDIGPEHEKNIRYAAMHRAAYRYYHDNINGLARPANARKEKLCFFDSYNKRKCGDYASNLTLGIVPDIRVWGKYKDGSYRGTDIIFNITAHELGHAAHCTWMTTVQFLQVKNYITESWADFVAWALSDIEYRALGTTTSASTDQSWNDGDDNYTPLFIDLVDTFNQSTFNSNLPNDQISGYEYNVINMLLLDSYGLSSLKRNLKLWKPNNVTDEQIDLFLEKYEELLENN